MGYSSSKNSYSSSKGSYSSSKGGYSSSKGSYSSSKNNYSSSKNGYSSSKNNSYTISSSQTSSTSSRNTQRLKELAAKRKRLRNVMRITESYLNACVARGSLNSSCEKALNNLMMITKILDRGDSIDEETLRMLEKSLKTLKPFATMDPIDFNEDFDRSL